MTAERLAYAMVQELKLDRLRALRGADRFPPEERAKRREAAIDELAALNVLERKFDRGVPA